MCGYDTEILPILRENKVCMAVEFSFFVDAQDYIGNNSPMLNGRVRFGIGGNYIEVALALTIT
jgi:hypothetical protein